MALERPLQQKGVCGTEHAKRDRLPAWVPEGDPGALWTEPANTAGRLSQETAPS